MGMVPVYYGNIMVESNPTEGYWEIPLCLLDLLVPGSDEANSNGYNLANYGIEGVVYSDKYITVSDGYVNTDYLYSSDFRNFTKYDSFEDEPPISNAYVAILTPSFGLWRIQIDSDIFGGDFGQYLNVAFGIYPSTSEGQAAGYVPIRYFHFTLRKMASGGGGGGSAPTAAAVASAVWNYGNSSTTIETRTLSSTVEVDPADIAEAVWNYAVAQPTAGTLGTRTLSSSIEVDADDIAEAVWNYGNTSTTIETRTLDTAIPTAANIATAVLTTDVGNMEVTTDAYTVKHLIMATQKSEVVVDNNETVWKIRDTRTSNNEPVVIASRTLTLNSNGAIVKTE